MRVLPEVGQSALTVYGTWAGEEYESALSNAQYSNDELRASKNERVVGDNPERICPYKVSSEYCIIVFQRSDSSV